MLAKIDISIINLKKMERRLIVILVFLIVANYLYCQEQTDTIHTVNNKFVLDKEILTPKKMLILMKDHPDAYAYMKKAKSNYDGAMVFSYIGGFCIGYPLGQALAGGEEPAWFMLGVGAGLALLTIPLAQEYKKNSTEAVRLYNSSVRSGELHGSRVEFGKTPNGIGFIYRL